MKFMCMHKVDAKMEAGERPSKELIQNMGAFIGGLMKSGAFKDGAGLHRSAARARVTFDGSGTPAIAHGPYGGSNELIASFALISIEGSERPLEVALERAVELGKAAGNMEIEVGPLVEGWDLNGSARPAGTPHRFLLLVKADAAFEAGGAESPDVRALLDRWQREGLLQSRTRLAPSKQGARTRVSGGKRHWVDGPFAESKELIAGFSVLELPSMDEAKRLTEEYVRILGDNECDVRVVVDA